jgi:hypothetical protein
VGSTVGVALWGFWGFRIFGESVNGERVMDGRADEAAGDEIFRNLVREKIKSMKNRKPTIHGKFSLCAFHVKYSSSILAYTICLLNYRL